MSAFGYTWDILCKSCFAFISLQTLAAAVLEPVNESFPDRNKAIEAQKKCNVNIGLIAVSLGVHKQSDCLIKGTLKAFNNFENEQKSLWSNDSLNVKVCIFWKCIQYAIHWDKTQMLKKFSFGQNKQYKKYPLFLSTNSSQFYF